MEKIDGYKAVVFEHLMKEFNGWFAHRLDIGLMDLFWISHQNILHQFPDCPEKEFIIELVKKERKKLADKWPETVHIQYPYDFRFFAETIQRLRQGGIISNELFPRFMELWDKPKDFTPIVWPDATWKLVVLVKYLCNRGILYIGDERNKPQDKFRYKKEYNDARSEIKNLEINQFIAKNFCLKNGTELTIKKVYGAVRDARRGNDVSVTTYIEQLLPIFGI